MFIMILFLVMLQNNFRAWPTRELLGNAGNLLPEIASLQARISAIILACELEDLRPSAKRLQLHGAV